MESLDYLFDTFQTEVFRLELLDEYKIEGEWEEFQEYLKNKPQSTTDKDFLEYLGFVKESTAKGRIHARCHVVTLPLSKYLEFQIQTGYVKSFECGEKIALLDRRVFVDGLSSLLDVFFTK